MTSSQLSLSLRDILPSLTLGLLKAFLVSYGWISKDIDGGVAFGSPPDTKGNRIRLLMPSHLDPSFESSLVRALNAFSVVRGYEFHQAIADLNLYLHNSATAHQAAMRIKIGSEGKSSISLIEVEALVKHARQALSHAVESEISHPYAFKKRVSPQASEAAQSFEFGQTQSGSFILVIRAPIYTAAQTGLGELNTAVDPQVRGLLRIARGLKWLSENDVPATFESAWQSTEDGLNANIAEHLNGLVLSAATASCGLYFNFSNEIPPELKPEQQFFPLNARVVQRLISLHRVLTAPEEISMTLTTRIITLHSENPLQEQLRHRITVEVVDSPMREIRGKRLVVWVDRGDYVRATRSHPAGRPVKITGTFRVVGNLVAPTEVVSVEFP